MDNTKDTPMDYKQFEGHTPAPWMVATDEFGHERVGSAYGSYGCLITEANGKFGNIIIADVLPITPDINSGMPNARLLAAAPDLLKENQELKLELQKQKDEFNDMRNNFHQINKQLMDDLVKQKELNAELVKMVEFYTKESETLINYVNHWDEGLKETKNEYANATIRAYKDFISSLESLIKKSH